MEHLGEHYIMDNRGQSDMGWLELFISLNGCVCLVLGVMKHWSLSRCSSQLYSVHKCLGDGGYDAQASSKLIV